MNKKLYGVWAFADASQGVDDWIRDLDTNAILAFESKREACAYAASNWGFATFTQAKRNGWCDVREL